MDPAELIHYCHFIYGNRFCSIESWIIYCCRFIYGTSICSIERCIIQCVDSGRKLALHDLRHSRLFPLQHYTIRGNNLCHFRSLICTQYIVCSPH